MPLSTFYQRLFAILIIANSEGKGNALNVFRAPLRYQAYVLRLWQEQAATPERVAVWRFMLEDPKTRQRRGFENLECLLAFLSAQMNENGKRTEKPVKIGNQEKGET
jgi:hypothetical protein